MPVSERRHPFKLLRVRTRGGGQVDRLEVFFDVVFVFAFFNIARIASNEINGTGLLRALLPLALLWRAWCSHILVANRVRPGEGAAPLVMFSAMAVAFVFALSIPQAFTDKPGGLPGPLLIAGCYATIRILHLALFWLSAAGNRALRRRVPRMARPMIIATVLLVCAAVIPSHVSNAGQSATRLALWVSAMAVEYGWLLSVRVWDWAVPSVGHWVERFELIMIIALGESMISVGIGSNAFGRPITGLVVIGATWAIVITAALWWGYFNHIAPKVRDVMNASQGLNRIAMARDAHIYLHLPMITGIILFALGGEDVLRHLGDPKVDLVTPLPGPGETLAYSGVILFFVSHLAFQLRTLGTMAWPRVVTIAVLAAVLPLVSHLPAIAALAILPSVCVTVVALEAVILGEQRMFVKPPDVRRRVGEAESARESRD